MIKKILFQHLRQKSQVSFLRAGFSANNQSKYNEQTIEEEDRNDATKRFLDSVTSTIKGITHVNYIVENDPTLTAEQKQGKKRFLIYRYNPAVTCSFFINLIIMIC